MMRSLYAAVSGLKEHQVKMDVIGNNIANVNTVGFKESNTAFKDLLSQTIEGSNAPAASGNLGGVNPMQVGLGVTLGSIDTDMTQGSAETTGKNTDLMLQGDGFFELKNGNATVYSRVGSFGFDGNGNFVDPRTGALVQGYSWGADDTVAANWAKTGPIKFGLGDPMPVAPSNITFDPTVPSTSQTWNAGTATLVDKSLIGKGSILQISGLSQVPVGTTPATGEFTFDSTTGTIVFGAAPTGQVGITAVDSSIVEVLSGSPSTPPTGQIWSDGATPPHTPPYNNKVVDPSLIGATGILIPGYTQITTGTPSGAQFSFDATTGTITFDPTSTINADLPINYIPAQLAPPTLSTFSIDQSGIITGVYTKGTNTYVHKIAQLAVANFSNPAGLLKTGDNYYTTTNNSGQAVIGSAGSSGRGTITTGALEMSNVDLSQEFTDMIVAQRGFQANSRVITVSDSLLEELINLKRS